MSESHSTKNSALNAQYLERRTLRHEEKAIRTVLKRAQDQLNQLQVEKLELMSRLRGQGQGQLAPRQQQQQQQSNTAKRSRRDSVTERMRSDMGMQWAERGRTAVLDSEEREDVNASVELELGVDHNAVLDKMMRGQFVSAEEEVEEEEEEEEDDDEPA